MPTESQPRKLTLGDRSITYLLKRSNRRTIGLSVDARGLRVLAPLKARMGDIEQLLFNHQRWVLEKLDAWQLRSDEDAAVANQNIVDGFNFPLFGQTYTLQLLTDSKSSVHWLDSLQRLFLHVRPNTDSALAFRRALTSRAKTDFLARIDALTKQAAQLNPPLILHAPPLSLSSARTRWGSCSPRSLRLNWRLIHFDPALIDYVVAHELAHLEEMNHSPRFWAVVNRLYPNWQAARARLRTEGRTCPRY